MLILGCKGLRIATDLHPNIILFMWLFSLHQVKKKKSKYRLRLRVLFRGKWD